MISKDKKQNISTIKFQNLILIKLIVSFISDYVNLKKKLLTLLEI